MPLDSVRCVQVVSHCPWFHIDMNPYGIVPILPLSQHEWVLRFAHKARGYSVDFWDVQTGSAMFFVDFWQYMAMVCLFKPLFPGRAM